VREREERQRDPRLAVVLAQKMRGEDLPSGHWFVLVEPVGMDDGRELNWHPPQPVSVLAVRRSGSMATGRARAGGS
jgi:hypothetical protein